MEFFSFWRWGALDTGHGGPAVQGVVDHEVGKFGPVPVVGIFQRLVAAGIRHAAFAQQRRTGCHAQQGGIGGIGGLVAKFQQAGLGDVVGSWIGTGHNENISGEQLSGALGEDTMAALARKLGVSPEAAASQISNILPGLIDHLTPQGQTPAGGLGNSSDLLGMLGGLMQKR